MSRVRRLALSAICALPLVLAACGAEPPAAPPPPEVGIVTVQAQSIPNVIELPGRIQAYRTSEVRARVDGIIEARLYDEGSDVAAGKGLFQIDPRQLRASSNAVLAQLERAQATAANAGQVVSRYQGLVADQAISKQEYDAAVAQQRTAQADVSLARAQLESARLNLGYSTVTAPISGRVGRAQVTEGALVSASGGTLLTTIEQIDRIYVNFSQSSSDLLEIRRNMASGKLSIPTLGRVEVQLVLEDGTPSPVVGHLDFLDLSIDEATGTAALRAEFANPGQTLLPGQFVRARIHAGTRPDGILIPQRAVQITGQAASVMVVGPDGKVLAKPVRLGDLQGDKWVILDGLKPGDRVIVAGLQKVAPGQAVRIAKPAAAKAQPAPSR
ncbi:efflux RND transporter periplasmic adaptor subunit [Sphingobium boeckii]|uniref:Membrane fusion protein (Multidrug efflux system) n=1 Tax=Sphingobium boeckii TaxID=1082345 RepID=A0A7W9AEQ0_9SPHN|nr:efflux RND transporter periplasmic adaptor subunit [Sphingobium boeckii]MBB5684208.1 membrane fusion protein (multidrug efflux system) [Sphingobium boeckii]